MITNHYTADTDKAPAASNHYNECYIKVLPAHLLLKLYIRAIP